MDIRGHMEACVYKSISAPESYERPASNPLPRALDKDEPQGGLMAPNVDTQRIQQDTPGLGPPPRQGSVAQYEGVAQICDIPRPAYHQDYYRADHVGLPTGENIPVTMATSLIHDSDP